MKNILEMSREELLALEVKDIGRLLTPDEVVHISITLGAFWTYDYDAAKAGKVGMHALLKSERHSDGFFVSKILLEPPNIRQIMADQIVRRLREERVSLPDYVGGVPDGATKLGEEVALTLGSKLAELKKAENNIRLTKALPDSATLLLIEDFCTRGTGFAEAVRSVLENNPRVKILPYDPVIINRGGLREIIVGEAGRFAVLPVVERRIQDWDPKEGCPLCAFGSKAIKPKVTEENWRALVLSQR